VSSSNPSSRKQIIIVTAIIVLLVAALITVVILRTWRPLRPTSLSSGTTRLRGLLPATLRNGTGRQHGLRERHPEFIIEHAVKGMLPKNRIAAKMLTKLRVFAGSKHTHEMNNPAKISV